MKKTIGTGFLFLSIILLTGCSMRQYALRQMTPIFEAALPTFYEESDLNIAKPALASNLKLLEGLLKSDPKNAELRLMLAQGYAGYALAFEEDTLPQQARELYLRARNYAFSALRLTSDLPDDWNKNQQDFHLFLKNMRRKNVAALFWAGFAWAGYVNLSLEDPGALLDLPKVEAIMHRVLELDSTYFYGGAYLFFGSIYGQKPRILGGNPELAKKYFEKNLKLTKGKFLLTYVYAAKFYAAKILDEALFDQYLNKVLETPLSVAPEIKLLNQVAKQKAKKLLAQKDQIF